MLTCHQQEKTMPMSTQEIFHDIYQHVILINWYSEIPEKQRANVKLFKR